jgi:hypothetical protein
MNWAGALVERRPPDLAEASRAERKWIAVIERGVGTTSFAARSTGRRRRRLGAVLPFTAIAV